MPGYEYVLLMDGSGVKVTVRLGAGGVKGKGVFIRAIRFTQGNPLLNNASASLQQVNGKWDFTGTAGAGRGARL